MSQGEDGKRDRRGSDLTSEIDQTMAEAEAAISALEEKERIEEEAAGVRSSDGPEIAFDGTDDADDEVDALAAQVESLRGEVASTKDKWLRAVADLENYKKRIKREMEEQSVRTAQTLLPSFLPVIDNLERALEAAPAAMDGAGENTKDVQQLVAGIELVRKEFLSALARHEIEPIPAVGVPFDPAVHDALQQIDSPDHAPGVVIREFEKGYKMRDRLLRPARVIVAGPGSTGEAG